ncbi:Protein phosphatase 1 regulatory subunit 37-like [Oopsacas minuta]|uniref:Protein phosphatase 1 regulatory subunit 37-like n=1 Tax=Oopsacas minuta TaxID=111878 RepID=A0AAV7JGH1_9METZ|nr:Protein phosphatase 1 regulatory subunit 37-like [Oopsacas minuta]
MAQQSQSYNVTIPALPDEPAGHIPPSSEEDTAVPESNCDSKNLDDIISSIGSFRRLILNPDPITNNSNNPDTKTSSEYERISESNVKRRKLRFNEEALSMEFVDPQRWKTENFSTIEEVIAKYTQTCIDLKIRASAQLLDQLDSMDSIFDPLEELHLRGIRLDSKQIDALDEVFRHVKSNIINVSKCSLEDDTFISICEMIEYYQSTKVIVIAHNPKIKIRGWIHLGRMMRKTNSVEHLDIGYCAIDNFSLPMFLRCIRANCLLQVLHLEGNGLSGKGIMILLAALKFNTNLKELYLGRNNLNTEDALHIASILRNNPLLEVIDLRDNAIQDRGLKHLSMSLCQNPDVMCMNSIFLTNNSITEAGIEDVAIILLNLSSIRTLSLSGNNVGNTGIQMLKPALIANTSLSKLGLRNSKITCEGSIAIAEVLAESKCMEVLDLRGNDIRIAGLMALSLAHKVNHILLNLQIPENIKADQRDRQLIIDVLNDLVNYRNRNHTQREAMFIAKSMEESLNAKEIGLIEIKSAACSKDAFDEPSFGLGLTSSLEMDRDFSVDSTNQLQSDSFIQDKMKLFEGAVLSADPDALANFQNSDPNESQDNELFQEDANKMETIPQENVEFPQLPDLLEEIPIVRGNIPCQKQPESIIQEEVKDSQTAQGNSNNNTFDLIDTTPDV